MSAVFDPTGDEALTSSLTGPLSSIEIPTRPPDGPTGAATGIHAASPAVRPLALRDLRPAPERDFPEYRYDPVLQVATDQRGQPLVPNLKKDWTTIEGTHTDGDGGDNEMWEWEEVK